MANPGRIIRPEQRADHAAIRHVHTLAFGQPNEANLVEALRHAGVLTTSLVAVQDGRIVGHIALSPVTITRVLDTGESDCGLQTRRDLPLPNCSAQHLGLGPMAVLPAYQRLGIGSQLVQAGLDACRQTNYGIVVVLGHPAYYPRFGFTPSKPHGIVWEHEVPEEAFMVHELKAGALAQAQGVVTYRPEFDHV